ncbi:Integrase, catalytic core,Ribonuclease H-like domain [Cinara cedri]|uniref:Integrase, catalytic core,Ribonuclease H-like domain n=1 Tax=Cinara cedri TaxID=506608 RepID=A0A5E4MH65_9HEMI|nr:Integrase, catalytic core,Ribonuclease H-like domain [Cinara cedri]
MAFSKSVTNANGTATISFLMDLITSYGVPKYFRSDRSIHFKNKEVNLACKKLSIAHIFSGAYHPQTNGMTELMNKIICNSLLHHVNENQKDWSLYYKLIIFAYNISPNSRLKVSAFYLLHVIEANQPIDKKLTTEDELFDFSNDLRQLQNIKDTMPKIVEKEQAMFFKILTVASVLINSIAEEDIAVSVSPRAFFDEVPEVILYDKSILLIYTQELQDDEPDDNSENIKNKWVVENN